MGNKLFSEDSIQKIIKRAAELQKEENQSETDSVQGLTMEELVKIGTEAGLDPSHIQMAAEELTEKSVTITSSENDTHIFEERFIETNISMNQVWEELRAEMRQNFNENAMFGKFKEDRSANEIVYNSMSGIVTTARFLKRQNGVNIQFSQRVGLASSLTEGLMYGVGLTILPFILLLAVFEPTIFESIALFSSLMVVLSLIVYALDVAWRKKKHRQLSKMLDKIVDQIPTVAIEQEERSVRNRKEQDLSSITIEDQEIYGDENNNEQSRANQLKNNLKE